MKYTLILIFLYLAIIFLLTDVSNWQFIAVIIVVGLIDFIAWFQGYKSL